MTSQRFTAIIAMLALGLGLLSTLDVLTPEIRPGDGLVAAEAARSGSWTCSSPHLARGDEVAIAAAAAPGGLEGSAEIAESAAEGPASVDPAGGTGVAAEVTFDRFLGGAEERVSRTNPFPEQATEAVIGHPQFPAARTEFGIAARWRRQPAALGRVWERSSEFGPGGLLAAPCVPGVSATWVLPGLSTAGGSEVHVVLSNPFVSDASVTLTLATPEGPEQPALLENVVVPSESVRLLKLNEFAPERRDVGVVITTRSGRVVAEALQSVNAAIGGIEGVTMVAAAPGGGDSWTIPWVPTSGPGVQDEGDEGEADDDGSDGDADAADDEDDDASEPPVVEAPGGEVRLVATEGLDGSPASWLWVTNVGDDDALLLVTVHGRDGGDLLDVGPDTLLPPGAIRRISLDGLLPDERAAITVATENGVPIVAAVATQVASDDEERTGFTVQLGASRGDDVWVLPNETGEDRQQLLALVNPGGEPAVAAVSAWTANGILRPEDAQRIAIPPGTVRFVEVRDLVDNSRPTGTLFVQTVGGQVVVGRVGLADEGRLDLVAHLGVPSSVWRGGTLIPSTTFDPSLTGEVAVVPEQG